MYATSFVFLLFAVVALGIAFVQGGLTFVFVSIGAAVASLLFLLASLFRRKPVEPATAGAPYGPLPPGAREPWAGARARGERPPVVPRTLPRRPVGTLTPRRPAEVTEEIAVEEAAEPEVPRGVPRAAPVRTLPGPPARRPAAEVLRPRPRAKPPARKPAKRAAAKPAARRAPARKAPARKPAAKAPARKAPARKAPAARAAGATGQVVAIPERGTYHVTGCRFVKGRRDTEKITRVTARRRGYSACGVCKPG